jgi:DNA-binding NarL/FixJ family response regulator
VSAHEYENALAYAHILVVTADATLRDAIVLELRACSALVAASATLEDAERHAAIVAPEAVVADVDGTADDDPAAWIGRVRARMGAGRPLPFVALTRDAHGPRNDALAAAGFDVVLLIDGDVQALCRAVAALLGRSVADRATELTTCSVCGRVVRPGDACGFVGSRVVHLDCWPRGHAD